MDQEMERAIRQDRELSTEVVKQMPVLSTASRQILIGNSILIRRATHQLRLKSWPVWRVVDTGKFFWDSLEKFYQQFESGTISNSPYSNHRTVFKNPRNTIGNGKILSNINYKKEVMKYELGTVMSFGTISGYELFGNKSFSISELFSGISKLGGDVSANPIIGLCLPFIIDFLVDETYDLSRCTVPIVFVSDWAIDGYCTFCVRKSRHCGSYELAEESLPVSAHGYEADLYYKEMRYVFLFDPDHNRPW